MAYQMYRSTTLGVCLQRTLDDFIQDGSLNPQLAQKVLVAFDKSINRALQYRARNKTTFKVSFRFVAKLHDLL
ncbi:hypothetical protein AB6A40_010506 [Gnathostoma spinigerum]|uniref:Transcription initiation factor IIA gamma subunit N-terminal domain-containing protein n=1 Tax=Gnathostoma spinigerum TaxID=75299 RepID=A0ABD6F2V5_9BILA